MGHNITEEQRFQMCYFLQTLTAKRSPNFYNITKSQGRVVRFCLFKQTYKLGEDIVGTFDFSEATVPCVQVKQLVEVEFSKCDNKSGKCTEPTVVHHIYPVVDNSVCFLPHTVVIKQKQQIRPT
jgi:hypothetical protein